MSRLDEHARRALMEELTAVVRRYTPEWTNSLDSDPGVTLVQLFGWLTDAFEFGSGPVSERRRTALLELLRKLGPPSGGDTSDGGLTRPRYFAGQLLTAADFQAEQDYVREKMRLHNRCLGGYGVVAGLDVTLDPQSGTNEPVITISPGCAITADGEELHVAEPKRCNLPTQLAAGIVVLRYFERAVDPVVLPDGSQECSRIKDGVAVDFREGLPAGDVGLARLERVDQTWTLDSTFVPSRSKFAV